METQELRSQLKADIIAYLTSAGVTDKKTVAKALQIIKDAAFQNEVIEADSVFLEDAKVRQYISDAALWQGDSFYVKISWNFAPRHYHKIAEFIQRCEVICEAEWEAEDAQEQAIYEAIQGEIDPLGDEYYDELGAPSFAAVVYCDRIEVRAFEPGVGNALPRKNRKYIGSMGDIRWQFPLSSLPEIRRTGCPIVDIKTLEKAN